MEDVLDLYEAPSNARRPVVCFDESSKQLIAEVRTSLPMQPGQPQIYDSEYKRNGTRNVFLFCEPKGGWRHIHVTEQRTMQDFAREMQWLSDVAYPHAEVIRVVLDNLNTHKPASLYETFVPEEARRLLKRLEFHYTPRHGSWLNMAEIEFSVLGRECLDRRIPSAEALERELAAYEQERNRTNATITWRFTNQDARTKLKRLYPSIEH